MDIEFAVDKNNKSHLLQVRKITTVSNWDTKINDLVSSRMSFLEDYINRLMEPRTAIYGSKTC